MYKNYFLLIFCCFMFNACATAYYSTERDPQIVFDKTKPLTIFLNQSATITDKKFGLLLGDLMVKNGFNVANFNIEAQETPCSVRFSSKITSSQYTGSYTTYHNNTVYIPGALIGNAYNPGKTITTTTPMTNVYTVPIVRKSIGVSIFCKIDNQEDSRIWFGFVSADIGDYKKYEENIIQNLIELMGEDFEGKLNIVNQASKTP